MNKVRRAVRAPVVGTVATLVFLVAAVWFCWEL